MAEHEYYEVNGRQIRVRPTESGQEIDEYGNFHRQPNHFTKGFGEGENPVEADRYILFWGKDATGPTEHRSQESYSDLIRQSKLKS